MPKLVEKHIIKSNDPRYDQLKLLCHLSKNLYNASLYDKRQSYFTTKKYKNFNTQRPEFVKNNNPDYRALPAKVAGEVLKQVDKNFSSFFALIKKKNSGKYDKPINIPNYLDKDGYNIIIFPKDTISKKIINCGNGLYQITVCSEDLNIKFYTRQRNINNVRVLFRGNHIRIEVVYTIDEVPLLVDNRKYAAIDLGVDNLCSLISNTDLAPVLINGKHIKSINQYYNKKLAVLKSMLPKGVKSSKRIKNLTFKREKKLDWEFHNVSNYLVNYLVSNQVNTLVIGYNSEWKQDINIGKRNNQNFVMIPFLKLVRQLEYKCRLRGIRVVLTREDYTSKTSFLDRERSVKHGVYVGCRVRRGLFRSKNGVLINADVNGAGQILRKVVPDDVVYFEGIEDVAVRPVKQRIGVLH